MTVVKRESYSPPILQCEQKKNNETRSDIFFKDPDVQHNQNLHSAWSSICACTPLSIHVSDAYL